ncbi:MAG: hypothetical protein U0M60_02240, partial [Clostridia bacterium]|nr:hypothetical protein [Clostridia bacterium]
TIIPGRQEMQKMQTGSIEEEHALIMEQVRIKIKDGLRISRFSNGIYSEQYARESCFEYLFDDRDYWRAPMVRTGNGNYRTCYKIRGGRYEDVDMDEYFGTYNVAVNNQSKVFNFIIEKNTIKELLLKKGETMIEEIKFSSMLSSTGLYIKCPEQEYIMVTSKNS